MELFHLFYVLMSLLFLFLARFSHTCTYCTLFISPKYSYLPLESPTITWCMGAPISRRGPQNVKELKPHGGPKFLKFGTPGL